MNEEQKSYQKKKNSLIIVAMILSVVLVCLICYIFIYAKNHPIEKFMSKDEIEIVQMNKKDYVYNKQNMPKYTEVTESTKFIILYNEEELNATVDQGKVVIKETPEDKILIKTDEANEEEDLNNNIKLVYQSDYSNLILTNDNKLYKILDYKEIDKNKILLVEQLIEEVSIKNIVTINKPTNADYVLTTDDKLINTKSGNEYCGIIKEYQGNDITLYLYDNYGFSFEEGKIFIDDSGTIIKFNYWFENKIISDFATIYEIDYQNKSIQTSNLGTMATLSYAKKDNDKYEIVLKTSTGYESFNSDYYYTK